MPKRGELTPTQKKAAAVGGTGALAAAAVLAILPVWEGKENVPYFDSVKVKTVCYGETKVEMRRYSDHECIVMLDGRAKQFQAAVLKVNPGLSHDPYIWAAHTAFAYNVGVGTYANGSVAKLYRIGRKQESCKAIAKYKYAGGKVLRGLELRRIGDNVRLGEVELCLTPYP